MSASEPRVGQEHDDLRELKFCLRGGSRPVIALLGPTQRPAPCDHPHHGPRRDERDDRRDVAGSWIALLPREQVGVESVSGATEAQLSKPRRSRDRALQKRVRERMKTTGEPYQLAWRRVTEADAGTATPLAGDVVPAKGATAWLGRSIQEFDAEIRRRRAAPPGHRAQYSLDISAAEAAFGFSERVVMVPMRMVDEPDRMRVVAVELFGIGGHFFAVKLADGGYETRGLEMHGPMESFPTLDELNQQYGSYRRISPAPDVPWSGTEDSTTHLPRARLGRAIYERFRLPDFAGAVYFADPTTGPPAMHLMVHFGQVQFEIIHVGARYARFFVDYAEIPLKDQQPDGRLRGEVSWPIGATIGDDKLLVEGLVLVELHATVHRSVGQGTGARRGSAPFLAMMQHLRDHTGEVEIDIAEPDSPGSGRHDSNAERRSAEHVACLHVLKDGRREFGAVAPVLEARVTDDECAHLLRAGAWRVVRHQGVSPDASTI